MSGVRDFRNPSDCSVLSHSDNRKICGSTFGTPKFRLTAKLHISPERCANRPKPLLWQVIW